uniref:heme oxygenase (biliverdin-producing) n=1 Tax=Chroomonas mesostigmatica CCMP1168 TaxID=1195612 RepID=A0A248SPS0_9CRYP|nr:heme oxygenase [Chroomonas mesostigmatica CCMP1168]
MTSNLTIQLREGTSKSHSMAENVSFVKSFLGGVIDKSSYSHMLANLYFVYLSLEEAMEKNKENDFIKPIYFPELNRTESLKKDLAFYYGEDWTTNLYPSEATRLYIDRIAEVSEKRPDLLVAHAYTRYLGDLSGGQILKKIAQRAMNLQSRNGLAFYEFDDIQDEQQFKQDYKAALDALPVDSKAARQIVAEANVAFSLNMKLFQELETSFIKIASRIVMNYFNGFFPKSQKESSSLV